MINRSLTSLLLLAALCPGLHAAGTTNNVGSQLLGTWELVSTIYGDGVEQVPPPSGSRRLKLVSPTHFTWMTYDLKRGIVVGMGGGRYTLTNETLHENFEFGDNLMLNQVGETYHSTDMVMGDIWVHSAEKPGVYKFKEIWRRVQPGPMPGEETAGATPTSTPGTAPKTGTASTNAPATGLSTRRAGG